MSTREEFEKWAIDNKFAFRDKNGLWPLAGVVLHQLQAAWQASRAAALEEAAALCDKNADLLKDGITTVGATALIATAHAIRALAKDGGE